jgi:energy-coupling factor transporter ATP-binding protein EcfA2
MREAWAGLLEKADLAVGACAGVVGEELLDTATDTVRGARLRLAYPEEVTVAALVGGTGSGKSSLLNAVMGAEIADTGGIRPTTSAPVAVTPRSVGEALDGYLARLGITEIHHDGPYGWLSLIDLPDTDSVEVGHRLQVERLLPVLDALIWVIDPEKYRDASFHRSQIAPLADRSSKFVFVLNQADRLDEETIALVKADLLEALREDGIDDPALVVASADPPAGPPRGVEELLSSVAERAGDPDAVYRRIRRNLSEMADTLLEATGGGGLDFEARGAEAVEEAQDLLSNGEEMAAVMRLTRFLDEIASESGEGLRPLIEAMAIRLPIDVRRAAEGSGAPLPDTVIDPLRFLLRRRARANAELANLALGLQAMGDEAAR